MNKVNKIHLGRQAFTISIDAYEELRSYLDAISKLVKEKEVVSEIEIRMAELLNDKGIKGNKVVILSDVNFLKKQLGSPKDFAEEDDVDVESDEKYSTSKKLYRDTENGMIAGVSAGLSKFFGLDVLIIRILFVIFTLITAGWGILLYILLWLLVPEARTSSERLQMQGKAVTLNNLKEVVENADVKGAAKRVNNTLSRPINSIFSFILKIVGLIFIIFGLSSMFGLIGWETYFIANNKPWSQYNIFPVGFREHLLVDIVIGVVALVSVLIIIFGIAIFQRKWPIKAWVTGVLVGLVMIGIATSGALAAVVFPTVRDAYNANLHTTTVPTSQFSSVNVSGDGIESLNYQFSDKYYVTYKYFGNPNLSTITTNVKNGTLIIDSSSFNWHRNCQTICIPDTYRMVVTIYSPNSFQLQNLPLKPVPDPGPVPIN